MGYQGTMYHFRLFQEPAELEQSGWQDFVQRHAAHDLADLAFLRAIHASLSSADRCFFALFFDAQQQCVACAVLSLFNWDPLNVPGAKRQRLLRSIRRIWPGFLKLPLLLCGPPVSLGSNLLVVHNQVDGDALAETLKNALEQVGRQCRCSLHMVTESAPEQLPLLGKLTNYGYQLAPSPPYYYFPSKFRRFSDYCQALQAKYRANVRRAQQHFLQSGFAISHLSKAQLFDAFGPDLYQLYLAVVKKSAYRFEVLEHDFFQQLIRHQSDRLLLTLAVKEERTVGFMLSLFSHKRFYLLFAGLDYQANRQTNVYYNLVYAAIEQALEKGPFDSIHVGQAADTFKARLGCQAVPMTLLLKARTRLGRILLDWFGQDMLTSPPPQPNYRVFKVSDNRHFHSHVGGKDE